MDLLESFYYCNCEFAAIEEPIQCMSGGCGRKGGIDTLRSTRPGRVALVAWRRPGHVLVLHTDVERLLKRVNGKGLLSLSETARRI